MAAAFPLRLQAVSLGEAVDAALAKAPALRAARAEEAQARAAAREVRSWHWPALRAGMDATRGDDPVYVFGSLLRQRAFGPGNFALDSLNDPGPLTNVRSTLEAGVPLFMGFELRTGAALAGVALRQANARSEAAGQGVRLAVVDAALRELSLGEQLRAWDERLASAAAELASARRLKAKGQVLESDFFAAEALEAGMKAGRVALEEERASLRRTLTLRIGIDLSSSPLKGRLIPPEDPLPSEDALMARALGARPELALARLEGEAAEASAKQESRGPLPRVEAFAGLETHTRDFASNPSQSVWGARASVALGDPALPARKARAEARLEAARASAGQAEETLRLEISQTLGACRSAEESLPLLTAARDRAAQALNLFRPLYREGRQSILDVLRAEEALARAEAAVWATITQAHTCRVKLLLAAGALDEDAVRHIQDRLETSR
jgi:outer membrane protein